MIHSKSSSSRVMVLRAVGEIALEKSVVPDDSGYRRVRSEGSTDDTDYYYNNACDDLCTCGFILCDLQEAQGGHYDCHKYTKKRSNQSHHQTKEWQNKGNDNS